HMAARGAEDSCGVLISVAQNVPVTAVAVYATVSANGNIKWFIFDHPNHQIVYISQAQPQAATTGWLQSPNFNFTMQAGKMYDIGAITDVISTWYFDETPNSQGAISSLSQNPNFITFANPTIWEHRAADCAVRLY